MKLKRNRLYMILTGLIGLLVIPTLSSCGSAPNVDWELSITGAVETPLTLSYQDLAGMEQIDLEDILMEKSTGEDEIHSWSGPAVSAILAQANATEYSSITALAADGYAVDVSRDEMQNAIIALKRDGEWITEAEPDKGPIRLVTPETPANRWVFQVQELQVNE
ncbi:MAG: molybdopterin-dependent oxidoreductase [Anaerolineae bacterium]